MARLDGARFGSLAGRARARIDLLERLRVDAATTAFGGDAAPVDSVPGGSADRDR